jgi:hypothetical protein
MFFSCADWETQVKQCQHSQEEQTIHEEQGFCSPSATKRVSKFFDKFGCKTEPSKDIDISKQFDVDLVMKMSCPSTGKLLTKRARQLSKPKLASPKKALRVAASKFEDQKETG